MLLNPNCSELISAIKIKTDQEFLNVIEELSQIARCEINLIIGSYSEMIYLDAERGKDGIPRLIFSRYDLDKEDTMVQVRAKIPISPKILKLENKVLDIDPEKKDWVFKDISLDVQNIISPYRTLKVENIDNELIRNALSLNREEKTFELKFNQARLDLSRLKLQPPTKRTYSISIKVNDLPFKYDSEAYDDFHGYYDEVLMTMTDAIGYDKFPKLRTIFRSLSPSYEKKFIGYDGGKTETWENWCTHNFPEYFINNIAPKARWIKGTFYILDIESFLDFKSIIRDFNNLGISMVLASNGSIQIKIKALEGFHFEEETYLIYNGKQYKLSSFSLFPKQHILQKLPNKASEYFFEINSYKEDKKNKASANAMNQRKFYIYVSEETRSKVEDGSLKDFFSYLERNSKQIEISW